MKKIKLDYLEYDIVSYCNLNCKGCSHFCNIDSDKVLINKTTYEKDLKRLSEFVKEIKTFRIMGGEPLINKELSEIIKITHKYYPESDIILVTNALLFKEKMSSLYETIKKYNVLVNISLYKENKSNLKNVISILKKYDIRYFIEVNFNYFNKSVLSENSYQKEKNFKKCSKKKCHNLSNGYLNICPTANYIERLNERFNLNYPNTSINIHDKTITIEDIYKLLNNPNEMCNHCTCYPVYFKRKIKKYNDAKEIDYIVFQNEKLKGKISYLIVNNYIYINIKKALYKLEKIKYTYISK